MTEKRRDFDAAATTWDEEPRRVAMATAVAEAIRREVPLSADWSAMDYGCGTGLVTLALAPHLGCVEAADSSAGMLQVITAKITQQGVRNVVPRSLDLEVDELPGAQYDLIFSSMTLHHVSDPGPFLARLAGALKPGGRLAIADLDAEDGSFHSDGTGVFHHGFGAKARQELFEGAGLSAVRTTLAHTMERPGADGTPVAFRVLLTVGLKGQ